jgi:hypothetical protein
VSEDKKVLDGVMYFGDVVLYDLGNILGYQDSVI